MDKRASRIQIRLLGGFSVTGCDGTDLTPPAKKARALLTYLALPPGQAWARERLVGLLWTDSDESQARASLRQVVAQLRRSLTTSGPLLARRDTIALDADDVSV